MTYLRKPNVGYRLVNALERALVYLKVVQVATAEPSTPVVGAQESAFLMQVNVCTFGRLTAAFLFYYLFIQ